MKKEQFDDLDMLLTCRKIAENISSNITDLQKANEKWNEDFAASLVREIDTAFNFYLGFESNKKIAHTRNRLNHIQAQALRAIAFFKTSIDINYALNEKRKNEILDLLGFKYYLVAVQEKDSNALLDLLSNVEKNLSDDLKNELIKNPGDKTFLERIVLFASKIKQANQSQKSLLSTKKAIEEDAKNIFNQVFQKILGLSKEITELYKDNPDKARLFDYTVVLASHFPDSVRSN